MCKRLAKVSRNKPSCVKRNLVNIERAKFKIGRMGCGREHGARRAMQRGELAFVRGWRRCLKRDQVDIKRDRVDIKRDPVDIKRAT